MTNNPSITAEINQSQTLVCFNHNVADSEKKELISILKCMGNVIELPENDMTFDEVVSRVAMKGGITEEGVKVVNDEFSETADTIFCEDTGEKMVDSPKGRRIILICVAIVDL